MAPELEDYWFERSGKGRWCGTKAIAWQGRALTAVYSAAVALAAAFLVERAIIGFVVALMLATAIYFAVVTAKTRCRLNGSR
ncbi:MAG TPA: hypothetical protein VGW40_02125 [Allosphingosinicella sp.]|nr:hypothetical protein [Allosphingosinicella sp.]